MALKESTRKLVLEKRDAIPADQRVKKSQRICDQLTQIALERWGQTLLIRPDPQVIWKNDETSPLWAKADAVYTPC